MEHRNGSDALRSVLVCSRRTVRPVVPGSREVEISFQSHDAQCRSSHLANIGPVPFSSAYRSKELEALDDEQDISPYLPVRARSLDVHMRRRDSSARGDV
jgi:hypothetical protein